MCINHKAIPAHKHDMLARNSQNYVCLMLYQHYYFSTNDFLASKPSFGISTSGCNPTFVQSSNPPHLGTNCKIFPNTTPSHTITSRPTFDCHQIHLVLRCQQANKHARKRKASSHASQPLRPNKPSINQSAFSD